MKKEDIRGHLNLKSRITTNILIFDKMFNEKEFPPLKSKNNKQALAPNTMEKLLCPFAIYPEFTECEACNHQIMNERTLFFGGIETRNDDVPFKKRVFKGRPAETEKEVKKYSTKIFYMNTEKCIPVSQVDKRDFQDYNFKILSVCKRCRSYCTQALELWCKTAQHCQCQSDEKIEKQQVFFSCFFDMEYLKKKSFIVMEKSNLIGYFEGDKTIGVFRPYAFNCCERCRKYFTLLVIESFYQQVQILKTNGDYDTDD